jgi:hypothetical protein
VQGGVIRVQHQLSKGICLIKWHSFDSLQNGAAIEIDNGESAAWQKRGNHREAWRGPKYRNHDFWGGYHCHLAKLWCHSLRKPYLFMIRDIKEPRLIAH